MITSDSDKNLSSKRYDSKLFNQVYKANLKAKSLEKEKKQRKNNYIIFGSIAFVVLIISLFIILKPKPPKNYLALDTSISAQNENISLPAINEHAILGTIDLDITAKSALVYDLNSQKTVLNKNETERMSIASITKLVTSMVMIDEYGLNASIEIQKDIPEDLEWTLGFEKGDIVSTDQLLRAMLISSYNDAAYLVANEYGYDSFIEKMNKKVNDLGCSETSFDNPMGYDGENHYSNANDLRKIVSVVLNYPSILEITDQRGSNISWISDGEKEEDYIYTTNRMILEYPDVRGLKTGFTEDSGKCLITLYDDGEYRFIVILLDSEDRFGETEEIIDFLIN